MSFWGLPPGTLLAIFASTSALTVLCYVLRLKRRPVAVPFSPIWQRLLRDREASELFSQLKRWLSLLLQLVLVLLLVMALGDPRFIPSSAEGRAIVILVDTSASMSATDVAPNRLGAGKPKLYELIRSLSGKDRALIAEMAALTRPLTPLTSETEVLSQAVERLTPSDTPLDLARGMRFAEAVLQGSHEPRIVILSDGAFNDAGVTEAELAPFELNYLGLGERNGNVAITGFSVRRYPLDASRHEVMLELTNTGDRKARVELTLSGDGDVLEVTELELAAGERLPRFYKDLSGANRGLEAKLVALSGSEDYLAADNTAYAVLPERRRVRVLLVSPGNTYLEAALLLDEYLDVSEVSPHSVPATGDFDVTIFDGTAPSLEPRFGDVLCLNPPQGQGPVALGRAIQDFGFDSWDKQSPVLRFLAPENIQVAEGFSLKPGSGDRILGASELGPILVEGRRGQQRFVQTGFDPRNSDFVLRVGFPLFVLNVINHFVEEDTSYVSSFTTGQVWRIPLKAGTTTAVLHGPGQTSANLAVENGEAVYFGSQAGFYELVTSEAGASEIRRFAANLNDLEESKIAPRAVLKIKNREATEARTQGARLPQEIWFYLLGAALLLSTLEWFTYHRRLTV